MVERNASGENSGAVTSAANNDTKERGTNAPSVIQNDPNNTANQIPADGEGRKNSSPQGKDRKLYKSPRFTGYLIMFLSSIINYHGVFVSEVVTDFHVVPSTLVQRQYGYIVAVVSCIASGFCVSCHLDRCSCLANTWRNKVFAHKSKFESILGFCLLLWWFMAVVIQTRCYGIAGDGKEQYNIYFSSWCCLFCAISIVQSKMMEYDWPSFKTFIKSWPHRAPGWIAIFVSDFFTLWWYVDVYTTYDLIVWESEQSNPRLASLFENINHLQYELLILLAAATLLPSGGFVFMEIFRDSSQEKKSSIETYIEAFCLLALACAWIPAVCVATTPGGFASHIGNSWFFTWGTCFFVMETLLWFVSDSRGGLHQTLVEKEQEYQQHQLNVLATAHKILDGTPQHQQHPDETEDGEVLSLQIAIHDPAHVAVAPTDDGSHAFEMKDISENDEELDESIKQEIQMKETNKAAYFDTLDDILE